VTVLSGGKQGGAEQGRATMLGGGARLRGEAKQWQEAHPWTGIDCLEACIGNPSGPWTAHSQPSSARPGCCWSSDLKSDD
jgi:hypothetical protein